jgi:hypothetical protein
MIVAQSRGNQKAMHYNLHIAVASNKIEHGLVLTIEYRFLVEKKEEEILCAAYLNVLVISSAT